MICELVGPKDCLFLEGTSFGGRYCANSRLGGEGEAEGVGG